LARKSSRSTTSNKSAPKKPGRPSEFLPEYCERLMAYMADGYSYTAFAGHIGKCIQTLYTWEQHHPEFLEAKKKGKAASQDFWERQGRDGLWNVTEYDDNGKPTRSKTLNATVWIFNMKNRFNWQDKQEVKSDIKQETTHKIESAKQVKAIVQAVLSERKEK
jgi:hypothetical protein